MSPRIHVESIESLEVFAGRMRGFDESVRGVVRTVERQIEIVNEWIQAAGTEAKRERDACDRALASARRDLRDCENEYYYYDEDGNRIERDCSGEADAVYLAESALRTAEERLSLVRSCVQDLRDAVMAYRAAATRLTGRLDGQGSRAISMLLDYAAALRAIATSPVDISPAANAIRAARWAPVVGSPTATRRSTTERSSSPAAVSGWTTRDHVVIDVSRIDHDENPISGPDEYGKVPFETMLAGVERFEAVVRPAVEKGADKDTFRQIDEELGLEFPKGYQVVYEAFYGLDPIRVTWDGSRYTAESGRHRIFAALSMGVTNLPARVTMRDADWAAADAAGELPTSKPRGTDV